MPKSWPSQRKVVKYISRPNPGAMKRKYSTSLVIVLRDVLGLAQNAKEAKYIVHNEEILVNNSKVDDIKYPISFFDIVEIKKTKDKFTVLFDELGRLRVVPVKDDSMFLKVSKKTVLGKKSFQVNCTNGFNVLVDDKTFKTVKVNDTLVYDCAKKKVSKDLNLKEGSEVYIFDGKFKGQFAKVKGFTHYNGLTRDVVTIEVGKETHSTAKDYIFVVEDSKRFK